MPTVRIQEKNYSESIMVLKLKDGNDENGEKEMCDICTKLKKKKCRIETKITEST